MPDQKTIRDDILELLDAASQGPALNFAAFLTANQLTPKQDGPTDWKIPCEDCNLCMIQMEPNQWRFTFFYGDYSGDFDEGLISAVRDNVQTCQACHDPCTGGINTEIFGGQFANVCSQLTIQFTNPSEEELEYIKELIEYSKKIAPGSLSWHAHH